MATRYFNKTFTEIVDKHTNLLEMHGVGTVLSADYEVYERAKWEAEFDCRVFNMPREEVTNYFLWRQQDAVRNSIQMVGQAYFSHSQLQRKNSNQIQEMLFQEHKINWNNFPVHKKRGSCIIKKDFWLLNGKFYPIEEKLEDKTKKIRQKWVLDNTMPELKGSNRNYVDKFVYLDE
jgi:tRNA(His) 5'-end guanylyltransferase